MGANVTLNQSGLRRALLYPWLAVFVSALVQLGSAPAKAQPTSTPSEWDWSELGLGTSCEADTDCAWDDPCFPRRCVGLEESTMAECEETAPPPGTCSCVENRCTLRPTDPDGLSVSNPGCSSHAECGLDVAGGRCFVGHQAGIGPIWQTGPMCGCDAESGRCVFEFVEPVACESFADCWYATEPRLHPIPAPAPREAPVEPCVDGEIDAVCADGVCRIVAWDC
jgi:hypothetical protein